MDNRHDKTLHIDTTQMTSYLLLLIYAMHYRKWRIIILEVMYYANFHLARLKTLVWFLMSTRFGTFANVICKGTSTRILTFRVGDSLISRFLSTLKWEPSNESLLISSLLFFPWRLQTNTKTNNVICDIRIRKNLSMWFCMKNKPERAPDSRTGIFSKFIALFISV